jgi:hypothetical protein
MNTPAAQTQDWDWDWRVILPESTAGRECVEGVKRRIDQVGGMEGSGASAQGGKMNGVSLTADSSMSGGHSLSAATEGRVGGWPAMHFLEDSFDSQEFVAKARRSMPLDDLLSELQGHLLKLRESLVDTINQDYTAFVGMASNLKGLDEALLRVRSPIENLRAEVDELRAAAFHAVSQVEVKLRERHSILSAHRRLELMLDAEQGLQRMEALLQRELAASVAGTVHEESGGLDRAACDVEALRASAVLERVANEAARLKGQIWRLDDDECAAIKQVMWVGG